jgi:hypothetical protein
MDCPRSLGKLSTVPWALSSELSLVTRGSLRKASREFPGVRHRTAEGFGLLPETLQEEHTVLWSRRSVCFRLQSL